VVRQTGTMGGALSLTENIACGHTDKATLWRSLLADRLSKPTADMVDALVYLRDNTAMIAELGERGPEATLPRYGTKEKRSLQLIARSCVGLLGYEDRAKDGDLVLFQKKLAQAEQFVEDLLTFRAQTVPTSTVASLKTVVQAADCCEGVFSGSHGEVLTQLAAFLRPSLICAEIYSEIRAAVAAGTMSEDEAAIWMEGTESDQSHMINAMGGRRDCFEVQEDLNPAASLSPLLAGEADPRTGQAF